MDSSIDRVIPLDELDDFKVAEGDPDVRGWDVLSADGRKIGEVDTLLVDTGAMKVRYLDVDVDDDLFVGASERHVLIPIGFARLDEDSDQIFVDSLTASGIQQLPEYRREELSREFETSLRGHFGDEPFANSTSTIAGGTASGSITGMTPTSPDAGATESANPDFYDHEIYREDRFYGSRRAEPEERKMTGPEEI